MIASSFAKEHRNTQTHAKAIRAMKRAFSQVPKQVKELVVAFSGGLDSCVLLHATQQLFPQYRLKAVHINHGLHPEASQWEEMCRTICRALRIPLTTQDVSTQLQRYQEEGRSPEDSARRARYDALTASFNNKCCLLTAHHLEDQAETFLLQLLRGAGVQGLGSMRVLSTRQSTYHLRPLLAWTRSTRLAYAKQHQLRWIEDSSNHDQHFRRNFLRHAVLPTLKERWPKPEVLLARAAAHCDEASQLSSELATADLSSCQVGDRQLSVPHLLKLSRLRQRNLVRYWLSQKLGAPLNTKQCQSIEELVHSQEDNSMLRLGAFLLKRYRGYLYLLKVKEKAIPKASIYWNIHQTLVLPSWGKLVMMPRVGEGICAELLSRHPVLEVRFRQGGERLCPKGRSGSRMLKKLFQEWGLPPWERACWPLLYQRNQLIAVPGYAIANTYTASPGKPGLWINASCSVTMGNHSLS